MAAGCELYFCRKRAGRKTRVRFAPKDRALYARLPSKALCAKRLSASSGGRRICGFPYCSVSRRARDASSRCQGGTGPSEEGVTAADLGPVVQTWSASWENSSGESCPTSGIVFTLCQGSVASQPSPCHFSHVTNPLPRALHHAQCLQLRQRSLEKRDILLFLHTLLVAHHGSERLPKIAHIDQTP